MNKRENPIEAYTAVATKQFAQNGFHGTSLAAVAKDASVSKQALLHFFTSKEQLYGEVLKALAARLCAEIQTSFCSDPKAHLSNYLLRFADEMIADPSDARLIIRALLDSDNKARMWPMKPYLDRMIELIIAASKKKITSKNDALAWLSPIIGAVQYQAISGTAIKGMYGAKAYQAQKPHLENFIKREIDRLTD